MKHFIAFVFLICVSCSNNDNLNSKKGFNENEILKELDLAYQGIPSPRFPTGKMGDIKYNFFLDLDNGYCYVANSKIHLYADHENWAIVFELSGYHTRAEAAIIELYYMGNCIDYPIDHHPKRNYISNTSRTNLITPKEFKRIENSIGNDMEQFELIDPGISEVEIRGAKVEIILDANKYKEAGIEVREYDNSQNLIGFEDLIRYLAESKNNIINATEVDIKKHIPNDLKKIMVIDEFHHMSMYENKILPSQLETYQLIANVLTQQDSSLWRPQLKPNNHWTNWDSGHL